MTLNLLCSSIQRIKRTSACSDYNSCHIQDQHEPESILTLPHRMPRYPGNQVSLSAKAPARWLPRSGNGTCGTRERADVPHFVFSTDPCGKASRSSGLQFATVDESSGQMSAAVGTRDIWGCDSWRKGTDDGPVTKSAVVRQGQTDKDRKTKSQRVTEQAAMGAPARWAKARSRRARRKYKGCVRDGADLGRKEVERQAFWTRLARESVFSLRVTSAS